MKIYKARTGNWRENIEVLEAEKVNDTSYWIKGRRNARHTRFESCFDTWEQAKAFLVREAESKISTYKSALEEAEQELVKIQSLQP